MHPQTPIPGPLARILGEDDARAILGAHGALGMPESLAAVIERDLTTATFRAMSEGKL